MSRGARLTILGLYNYNEDIFAGFNVPDGMDRETALNEILLQCGDLELIYPTYNILKLAITNWTKVEMPIWTKLYKTENFDYNPIWNVDGKVVETGTRREQGTNGRTGSNNTSTTNNSTRTGSTKGYNETSWLENEKDVLNGTESGSGNYTENVTRSDNAEDTRETIRTGNIGVTTTQSMIKEERDVDTFSTIKYIVDSFKKRFCIMIY